MNADDARGLTTRQAWTLQQIERCYCCGAWTVVTKHGGYKPAICSHLMSVNTRKAS